MNIVDEFEMHVLNPGSAFVLQAKGREKKIASLPIQHVVRTMVVGSKAPFDLDFTNEHPLFSAIYGRIDGMQLYCHGRNNTPFLFFASVDESKQWSRGIVAESNDDGFEGEIEDEIQDSFVFAKTPEGSFFLYRTSGSNAGTVFFLQPSCRWGERLFSLSFEGFLKRMMSDPVGFLNSCDVDLDVSINRKRFSITGYVDNLEEFKRKGV